MNLDDLVTAQPAPLFRPGGASMHDVASALHQRRKRHGLGKYASLLQARNRRDAAVDVLQEQLDRVVYDLQVVCEQAALAQALAEFRAWLAEEAAPLLDGFDAVFDPVALAQRADVVAQSLIAEDADESRARRGAADGSVGDG